MTTQVPTGDELRLLVRSLLRELVPARTEEAASGPCGAPMTALTTARQQAPPALPGLVAAVANADASSADSDVVSLRTDAELDAFVHHLLDLFDNPRHRAELRSGARRFRLGGTAGTSATTGATSTEPTVHRVERGAVTELHVKRAAAAGARLVLGPRAVLTPLARDRARGSGVLVERER